jgi:hypothetical protein
MSETGHDRVVYTIDAEDRICEIGEGWQRAATIGAAADALAPRRVLGRPVAEFIMSAATVMYYQTVFRLCRLRGEAVSREYRCDSTTHKRFMLVTMTPEPDDRITLEHVTLREEPLRHPVEIHDQEANLDHVAAPELWRRCSMCNRLQPGGRGDWLEPDEVAHARPVRLLVIHAVCKECRDVDWRVIRIEGLPGKGTDL